MHPKKILLIILLSISVAGCAPDIIDNYSYNYNTTLGQELIDLKKALDEGAINKEQYAEMVNSLKEARYNE